MSIVNDLAIIFYWWFLLFALGITCLPLTFYLFGRFFDKGYAFAKILAILLISYSAWLLGSLKVLPFSSTSLWLLAILITFGLSLLFKKQRRQLKKISLPCLKIFAFEEFLFFCCLVAWAVIRGYQPNIQGLEKFMDYGFLNSILRSDYFPPADMWLAGETINYYYFGHLISAALTKMSNLDSAITYNLMIATIFGLAFSATFCLGANLTFFSKFFKKLSQVLSKTSRSFRVSHLRLAILTGLLSAFLLTLGGNLHPLWWHLKGNDFKTYWYPDATRFIITKTGAADNTIHEFPIYSFVVADLHGHMINLPNVLLMLGLILAVGAEIKQKKKFKKILPWLLVLSLSLALAFMTNAWDYPIYLLAAGGSILLFSFFRFKMDLKKTFIQTTAACLLLVIGSLIFSLPFHLNFKNIAQGIDGVSFRTPFWMLLVLWGLPLSITISFLIFTATRKKFKNFSDHFVFIILGISWLLILIPELIFLKDIYIHSHQRANTMFKLTYQAFVMFSISSGYIVFRILAGVKKRLLKSVIFLFIFAILLFPLLYPRFAIRSYYGLKKYQGLNGITYLEKSFPEDYQSILWLNQNLSGQPVIAEAVGESYTDFARISANTGLPTVLGWRVHEWLWRGSFDEPGKRTEAVKTIYESPDLSLTKNILNQYQVEFVLIGDLERQQYSNLFEEKFDHLGQVVFSSGDTKIYQLTDQ